MLVMESLWNQGGSLCDAFAYKALLNKAISKNTKPNIPLKYKIFFAQTQNREILSRDRFVTRFNKYEDVWENKC